MGDELVLYTNPMSRGRTARWMLEEVGAPYETVLLDYSSTMKAVDYLAVNPMGKVPAIRHGRTVVTEVAAICAYLADAFPAAGLAPPAGARGDYYRWLFFAAGPLEAAITNQALGVDVPAEKQGFVGYGTLERVLDVIEQAVTDRPFVAGDAFSAADLYLGAQLGVFMQFGSIPKRPAFVAYYAGLAERPAMLRAGEIDNGLLAEQKRQQEAQQQQAG